MKLVKPDQTESKDLIEIHQRPPRTPPPQKKNACLTFGTKAIVSKEAIAVITVEPAGKAPFVLV